jgi:hypothetical protein
MHRLNPRFLCHLNRLRSRKQRKKSKSWQQCNAQTNAIYSSTWLEELPGYSILLMGWSSQLASSYRTPISSETAETRVLQNAHAEVREAVVASELPVRIDFGGVAFGVVDFGVVDFGGVDLGCLDLGCLDLGCLDLGCLDLGYLDLGCLDLGCLDLGGVDLDCFDFDGVDNYDGVGVNDFDDVNFVCLDSGDVDLGDVALRKC